MKKVLLPPLHIFLLLWILSVFSNALPEDNSVQIKGDEQFHSPEIKKTGKKRIAFLFGNSSASDLPKLKYVQNDLRSMQKTLTEYCNVNDTNIIYKYNERPDEIETILDSLCDFYSTSSASPTDAMFLLYYSGHADKGNLLMGEHKFSFFRLKRKLQSLPFKLNIYIIDACHSGNYSIKGSSPDSSFLPDMKHIMESNIEGNILIYSSAEDQKSHETNQYEHSVFTYHFINALQGAADFSEDNRISLDEAYAYAFNNTVSENDSLVYQRPGRQVDIRGEGDIILAQMHTNTSGVRLDKSINGLVRIEDKYGNMVAEIFKKAGYQLRFALEAGKKFYIINIKEKLSYFKEIRTVKGSYIDVNRPDLTRKLNTDIKLGITLTGVATNLLSDELRAFSPQGGIELIFRKHVQMYLNVGFLKIKNVKKYSLSKQIDDIRGITGQLGLGYNFWPNLKNKFWFIYGIDFIYLKNRISCNPDQKEGITLSRVSNLLIIPHIKVSYKYPLSSLFKIGLSLLYHPDVNLQDINKKREKIIQMDYSNFMSSGFDIGLMVTYTPPRFRGY